jgi:polysaccharide pyruvyl transferase WcaK-like protein
VAWSRKKHSNIRKSWRSKLSQSDVILIGGGQLITAGSLARLFWISYTAKQLGKPVYFVSVGIDSNLNIFSKFLLWKILNVSDGFTVRTSNDKTYLEKLFPRTSYTVISDPALITSRVYPLKDANRYGVGVNLQNPKDLRGCDHLQGWHEADLKKYFLQVGQKFLEQNQPVFFYTNGDNDDIQFKNAFMNYCHDSGEKRFTFIDDPQNGKELATTIGSRQLNICCRMHSAIISYSYNIPFKVIAWNPKILNQLNMLKISEQALITGDVERDTNVMSNSHRQENFDLSQHISSLFNEFNLTHAQTSQK